MSVCAFSHMNIVGRNKMKILFTLWQIIGMILMALRFILPFIYLSIKLYV